MSSSNTFRNFMIVLLLLVLIGSVLFLVYQAKVKDNNTTTTNTKVKTNSTSNGSSNDYVNLDDISNSNDLTKEELIELGKQEYLKSEGLVSTNSDSNSRLWWFVIAVIFVLILGMIYYFYIFRKTEEEKILKQPVPIDRIKEIFREKISKDYGLGWYVDENGKFQLQNDREFYYRNQRVWYHRATGDKFLLIEFILNNGPMFGFHIALIPADKGEKPLWESEWTIEHKTDSKDFKLLPKTYPVSSIEDKKERQQMYIAEQIASGNPQQKDAIDYLNKQNTNETLGYIKNQSQQRSGFISPFSSADDMNEIEGYEDDGEDSSNISTLNNPKRRTNYYRSRSRGVRR